MRSKKILVVAESINVDDSSGSKANVALIHNLQQAGFQLLVLHYTRKNIELAGVECVSIKEKKFNLIYLLSRFQRKLQLWFGINLAKYLEPKFGFSFTFFNDVKSIKTSLQENKDFKPDLVLTLSKGASFRPHYALLHFPHFHDQWMAYIHDPYPFHYYPKPYKWDEPGYQKKIDFFEKLSHKCRWAGFPSLLLKEWMILKFPGFKEKGIIIPHQIIEPENKVQLPEFFKPEKFTLLHAGNLMKQRPPFHLINSFQKFIDNVPEARDNTELLFIGNASYHQEKLHTWRARIPQLVVKNYLDYKTVSALQKSVSVNIILESKAEASPFLPGKFPHCIVAEKPILLLGPRKSECLRLLGKDYPYWSETNDEDKITELLVKLYENWKKENGGLKMNREDLKSYLSASHLKAEIENILN